MTDSHLDTERTNPPLAGFEAVVDVVLPHISGHEARVLARKTLPGNLEVGSVGGHTLAETTSRADANATDLLEAEGVHDVADRRLAASHGRSGGIFCERLHGCGGMVGLRGDLGLRGRQLCSPDDIADDSARCVCAILQSLCDERGEDVGVQLRALQADQVEFDGFAKSLGEEGLERSLGFGSKQICGESVCSACNGTTCGCHDGEFVAGLGRGCRSRYYCR